MHSSLDWRDINAKETYIISIPLVHFFLSELSTSQALLNNTSEMHALHFGCVGKQQLSMESFCASYLVETFQTDSYSENRP